MNFEVRERRAMSRQKILTLHGQRAWHHHTATHYDPEYAENSIDRGYRSFTRWIDILIEENPGMVIQSVSISSVTVPEANGYIALHMYATIVYTGDIQSRDVPYDTSGVLATIEL